MYAYLTQPHCALVVSGVVPKLIMPLALKMIFQLERVTILISAVKSAKLSLFIYSLQYISIIIL